MRLFAAIDIPEDVRERLAGLIAKLRSVCGNARWARVEGLHVTLKFIGEVPQEKVKDIQTSLRTVEFSAPIAMHFGDIGFFPNSRRPRVLWAGVKARRELAALAMAVEAVLEPFGVARAEHPFSPHLTLARFDSPKKLGALHSAIDAIGAAGPLEFGNTTAKEFHLYQSVLKSGGAEYTRLATFTFVGSKPE